MPGPAVEQLVEHFSRHFPVRVQPPEGEGGASQLFVALEPDARDRPRVLELVFMPERELHYLQYFAVLPLAVEPSRAGDLARTILMVNAQLPIGGYGLKEEDGFAYFRVVVPCPPEPLNPEREHVTVSMIDYILRQTSGVLELVAGGEGTLDDARRSLAAVMASQPKPHSV